MRYLVLSDIHGNWEALRAVLQQVRRKRFDATLMLGDVVGYGAAPNQVVEGLRSLPGRMVAVRGNHDKVVAGLESGDNFNHAAREAALWTRSKLSARNLRTVLELPQGPLAVGPVKGREDEGLAICHGSPVDEDAYIFSDHDALAGFQGTDHEVVFFGHTHVTSVFALHGRRLRLQALGGTTGRLDLEPGGQYLINPGSVGQPRDGDPRASYMIYDSDRRVVRWYRIDYPVERSQGRIRAAGLPEMLAARLEAGT